MTMTIISITAFVFSCLALLLSLVAISMVCGFLRSTHTVQWVPMDAAKPQDKEGKDTRQYMGENVMEELENDILF